MSPGQYMASYAPAGTGSSSDAGKASGNAKQGTGKYAKTGAFAGVKPGGTSPTKVPNFNFKDDAAAEGETAVAAPTSMDEFQLNNNDINKDSGASIFQIISERYIKSGNPALLEEIKE